MTVGRIRLIFAAFVFVGLWIVLVLVVSPEGARRFFEDQDWFRMLRPVYQDWLLSAWPPVLAVLLSASTSWFIERPSQWIADRFFPPFPFFLRMPDRDVEEWTDFRSRFLPLVGREPELEALREIERSSGSFAWCWVQGPGGVGKSRLVLEWVLEKRGGDTGYLRRGIDLEALRDWKPARPTTIVCDDAGEYKDLLEILDVLADRADDSQKPVRLLLVERTTPWHLERRRLPTRLRSFEDERSPLEIPPLGEEHLDAMVANFVHGRRKSGIVLSNAMRQRILAISGGNLFITLLALDTFVETGDIAVEKRLDLLEGEVLRRIAKLRDAGIPEGFLPSLALATLARGIDWESVDNFYSGDRPSKQLLDRVLGADTAAEIPPLQPEIIGQLFILEQFSDLYAERRERFLETAWNANPSDVGLVLYYIWRDFPEHASLSSLDAPPAANEALIEWARVRVSILSRTDLSESDIDDHWRTLKDTAESHPHSRDIQLAVAEGAGNVLAYYADLVVGLEDATTGTNGDDGGQGAALRGVLRFVDELRTATDPHYEDPDYQALLAVGLVNASIALGSSGDLNAMEGYRAEVQSVRERFPGNERALSAQARAECQAIRQYVRQDPSRYVDDASASHDRLIELSIAAPDNIEAQLQRVYALGQVAPFVANRAPPKVLFQMLSDQLAIANEFPERPTFWLVLMNTARLAIGAYTERTRETGFDEPIVEAFHQLFELIQGIAAQAPEHQDLQDMLAGCAATSVAFFLHVGDTENVLASLDITKEVAVRYPNEHRVQEHAAGALGNAITWFAEAQRWEGVRSALIDLRVTADRFPDDPGIQRRLAGGLNNAMVGYGNAELVVQAHETYDQLQRVSAPFHDRPEYIDLLDRAKIYMQTLK